MGHDAWQGGYPPTSVDVRVEQLEQEVRRLLSLLAPSLDEILHRNRAVSVPLGTEGRPVAVRHNDGMAHISFPSGRAKHIRLEIRKRRQRERHFPADLFADPAWDMLLDLYAAHYEGKPVSVSSLCIAANVPSTTALRWIKLMCDEGWFLRTCDPDDGRRIFISLAEDARCRLDAYFEDVNDW